MMLAASLFAPASLEKIAGYAPGSQATDHNAVDLDQAAMETYLKSDPDVAGGTNNVYTNAKNVYEKGGHSKSYTALTLPTPHVEIKKGDKMESKSASGATVYGKAYDNYASTAAEVRFQYSTTDSQWAEDADGETDFDTPAYQTSPCRVGGMIGTGTLKSKYYTTDGCIAAGEDVTIVAKKDGSAHECTAAACTLTPNSIAHKNGRTLKGFSTGAEAKMYAEKDSLMTDGKTSSCKGCPYTDFKNFYAYYGSLTYADDWVQAALGGTATDFTNGGADFSAAVATHDGTNAVAGAPGSEQHHAMRIQSIKKGTAYLNTWMYVIREFEDAIDDCSDNCIACNDDPVHAWDEGVAFWTGSLEGKDGYGSGKQIFALAEKRCKNYNTCGPNGGYDTLKIGGGDQDTTAKVNFDLFYWFANAQYLLVNGRCDDVKPIVRKVVGLMTVPLIQGTLRYTYKMHVADLPVFDADDEDSTVNDFADVQSEAAVFAAAVLPMIHGCSPTDAATINAATKLGVTFPTGAARPAYDAFTQVKVAFENNYECLGITCEDVGGLWGDVSVQNQAGDGRRLSEKVQGYFRAFSPCKAASMSGGEYADIAGYAPGSQVTDHNAVDLDQAAMEDYIKKKTEGALAAGQLVYEKGGNSKSYLEMTLADDGSKYEIKKGAAMYATDFNGHPVEGKAYDTYSATATTKAAERVIRFQYKTSDDQASYVGCHAGGMTATLTDGTTENKYYDTSGCVDPSKPILVTFDNGDDTTSLLTANLASFAHKNGRTLQGFSTGAQKKMYVGCKGCPYKDYKKFYEYYGSFTYADDWVTAAFDGTKAVFTGPASDTDFGATGNQCPGTAGTCDMMDIRVQSIKKGTAYMNVWMYVIREFEDAIDDCLDNCIACNDDPVHAWDEGVAFYTGSLAGTSPNEAGGKLIWALAEKRCQNYKTCGPSGDSASIDGTTAKVNNDLLFEFNKGRDALKAGKCDDVRPITDRVVSLMTIPLIQGTMRYARYIAVGDIDADALGEAAVFAASVLPMVHACSAADAKIIDDWTKLGQTNLPASGVEANHQMNRFTDVKKAFERNYACMGVTCADIGGLYGTVGTGKDYYKGASPCKDSDYYPPPSPSAPPPPAEAAASLGEIAAALPTGALVGIIVAAVVAVFAVLCVVVMVCKERSGSPIFTPLDVKPSV